MAGKVEALKLLCWSLQSHKVQEAKMADFCSFHGLLTHWRQHSSQKVVIPASVPIQWLCSCLPFVILALTRFEVQSHKVFSHCFVLTKTWQIWQKREQVCLVTTMRLLYLHSLQKACCSVVLSHSLDFVNLLTPQLQYQPTYYNSTKPLTSTIAQSVWPSFYMNVLLTWVVSDPVYIVYMIYDWIDGLGDCCSVAYPFL